jgi:hypothetical protein
MATNPTPPPGNTGGSSLGGNLHEAAGNLVGPALDLAQGATAFQAASNALKGAALDKLLGPTALFAGGLIGVLRTVKSIVEQSGILERGMKNIANIQQIEGKFETLLKSADAAGKRIKELYKFTASSPFDFRDVAEANRILESLSKGALSGADSMKMVGDVAASTGLSMSETAGRVGKLYAAIRSGRSLDKIMFQLQMTGAATDELAAKLETLQQAGAGADQMWEAITQSLKNSEGGMKNEMKNLDALGQRLKFAGEQFSKAFSEPFVNAQAEAIETSIKATQNLTPLLAKLGKDLAPILQFMSSAKNSVTEATLATKGFADVLSVAWEASKSLFVGLAGTTLAVLVARTSTAAVSVLRFGSQLNAAATIARASASSIEGFANATALAKDASAAFARSEYLSAAALKLKSLWSVVATTATDIHAASMIRARTATNGVSIATYLWATATQVAVGGLNLLKAATQMAGRAMLAFAVANPILLLGTAVLGVAYAMEQWRTKIDEADGAYNKLIFTMSKVRAEMREQVAAIRNLDQWKQALADNDKRLKENGDAQKQLGARPVGAVWYGLGGERIELNKKAREEWDAKNDEHNLTTRSLVADRAKIMTRDMDTVGLGSGEQAKLGDQVAGRLRIDEARRQAGAANADEGGRLAFLNSEIERLNREADIGEAIDRKRTSPERNPGPTELTKLQAQIDAIEAGGAARPGELNGLYQQRTELGNTADTYTDKRAQALALEAERKALRDTLTLKALELDLEQQIATIRAVGWETAGMEATKELIILKEQLRIAKAKGKLGEIEARVIETKIKSLEAERAKGRAEIAVDRAKNNAVIKGNSRAAQALQDNTDLAKMRADYEAKGLTAKDANSDWAAGIKAQAVSVQPRIVADSMQSIGGGGGSYGGDPMLAAQQRIAEAGAQALAVQRLILSAVEGSGSTLRD